MDFLDKVNNSYKEGFNGTIKNGAVEYIKIMAKANEKETSKQIEKEDYSR